MLQDEVLKLIRIRAVTGKGLWRARVDTPAADGTWTARLVRGL